MTKQLTKVQKLEHENRILNASKPVVLSKAFNKIDTAGSVKYFGSGVTITIKNINTTNNVICEEFCIFDGLSSETIEAIKRDILKSAKANLTHPIHNGFYSNLLK
ncbi:MAG: hypothetical protein PF440_01430 [Thiomicrorhabdus sp.]|jgi:hypothetical protein|nr:hypothetical protein [Thiomicrorhabdus sp.]